MKLDAIAIRKFMTRQESGASYVYEKTYRIVYSLCFSLLHNPVDAEDASMEAYANVLQSGKAFPNGKAFLSYLCIAAKHSALDIAKKRGIFDLSENEEDFSSPDFVKGDDALLLRVKEELGESDYELLILHLVHGLAFPLIAEIQGGSASSCRGRYSRALAKLRGTFRKEDFQ